MAANEPRRWPLDAPEDVFVLRQTGRVAAATVGCDDGDQVRLATALSEVGREAVALGGGATARFDLARNGALTATIDRFPATPPAAAALAGVMAARRLVEDVVVGPGDGTRATISLRQSPVPGAPRVEGAALHAALGRTVAARPLDELRLENRDLVATLTALKLQADELVRLNAELEETNRGVMAMYQQLAGELDETNRGVVALYAEIDDKTVQLNAANEAKTRFLQSVSHELRSPVNSVIGLTGLLLDPHADAVTPEQRRQLDMIGRASAELLLLVNGLLDLAKAESGRLQTDPSTFDLGELLAELRGTLRPLARAGVALVVDAPGEIVVETDRLLLAQVVRNLVGNALKFTARGSVEVRVVQPSPFEVEICVSDTGIGIAPQHLERVFEEFFQVRGELQAQFKGTGLGLPYARRVAETLGGRLTVSSDVGRGSQFVFRFPVRWQPLVQSAASPSRARQAEGRHVDVALIVDDDSAFRTTLRGMLQGVAREVVEAESGTAGLHAMRTQRPDVVFVDLRMPDMDGSDVVAHMSADIDLRAIPVVIVSATDVPAQVPGAARTFLAKTGVQRERVLHALDEALA